MQGLDWPTLGPFQTHNAFLILNWRQSGMQVSRWAGHWLGGILSHQFSFVPRDRNSSVYRCGLSSASSSLRGHFYDGII